MKNNKDYFLGTDLTELERLKLQHDIWKPYVLEAWKRAGISSGSKVIDIGAGPGYASFDLSQIVGKAGEVYSIERSVNFTNYISKIKEEQNLQNLNVYNLDLIADDFPNITAHAAWCRWVACFVSDPKLLIHKINKSLRNGGVAIFYEYINYESFRLVPRSEALITFVENVVKNWRESGGEPDIANVLPTLLAENGFKIISTKPHVFSATPSDLIWQWPFTFVYTHVDRLFELGKVSKEWVSNVRSELIKAQSNPESFFITPTVLEIIAEKIK
ncbi:MAG: methyltransferase domain-containing protein [Ignavibacteria bacterium]|nr:methyltransferase domain-containing protein [Ignavibacteria bacterium]